MYILTQAPGLPGSRVDVVAGTSWHSVYLWGVHVSDVSILRRRMFYGTLVEGGMEL